MKTRTTAIDWREDQLRQAGFTPELAGRVASDRRFDLHAVIELVERGCPPELAVRILAPLGPSDPEEERRRL
jgi:hypothetical protein